jgi:hypothetical protein
MSFPAKIKILFLFLHKEHKLTKKLAEDLCNIQFCKDNKLQTEFAVFRRKGMSEFDKYNKHRRYYPANKFTINVENNEYIFTNNWFERNSYDIGKFFSKYLSTKIINTVLEYNSNHEKKPTVTNNPIHKSSWPKWELPSEDDIMYIAKKLTPYLRFLNPKIIEKIVLSNIELEEFFNEYLEKYSIEKKYYIWDCCANTFPGIRRANGKTDNKYKKKQLPENLRREKNAIYIDDNSYPKHIWSFLFTGKQFSNIGPEGYELAHIFEHKAVDRVTEEFICKYQHYNLNKPLSGMFTNIAGLMYAPRTFVKITDHSLQARRLIQRKVILLYKDVANVIPPEINLKEYQYEWDTSIFKWLEPVGKLDNIDAFISFRKERINKILDLEIPKISRTNQFT